MFTKRSILAFNGSSFMDMQIPQTTTNDDPGSNTHAHGNSDGMNNSPDENSNTLMGSASDFILIAMIIAMMLCMAVCCLCLFCRQSSRITLCGFNFEVNDRSPSVAIDELSELHEVVPLTPTVAGSCDIPDIENILQSDPPPPRYSDVANTTMLDRFKWKSKRRGQSTNEDKSSAEIGTGIPPKAGDMIIRGKSKKTDKRRNRVPRISWQRSASFQHPRVSTLRGNASIPAMHVGEENKPYKKPETFLRSHTGIHHSASDSAFNISPSEISNPITELNVVDEHDNEGLSKPLKSMESDVVIGQNYLSEEGHSTSHESNNCKSQSAMSSEPSGYDDEVFM